MSGQAAIHPFQIHIGDRAVVDLHTRLISARWPDVSPVTDWSQGVPLHYARALATYWCDAYNWRAREALLNRFDQFTTEIDGLNIHFVHQRSPHRSATPLLITHGWPGSVVEFQKVIDPLTNPTAYGGRPKDAFHVVCPSLPGFGFSAKPAATGWGIGRIARAWDTLMVRLGYDHYGAQGGDWGAAITTEIGHNRGRCIGIHLNMPIAEPPTDITDPSAEEQQALAMRAEFEHHGKGYSQLQATKPQTLGYGLTDSPLAQMAWIVEKFQSWMDCDGHPENILTRDEILDNVMLYWLTGSGPSSARLYWEHHHCPHQFGRVELPTGVAAFPKEILPAARSWCEPLYNITHWSTMDRGGHFAAFEQPELFVQDVRAFFATIR